MNTAFLTHLCLQITTAPQPTFWEGSEQPSGGLEADPHQLGRPAGPPHPSPRSATVSAGCSGGVHTPATGESQQPGGTAAVASVFRASVYPQMLG